MPTNSTDCLQPLNVNYTSVNNAAVEFLLGQFHYCYAKQICDQLNDGTQVVPVDLCLSVVKPIGAQWMMKLYDYLKAMPEIIVNGFGGTGITYYLTSD